MDIVAPSVLNELVVIDRGGWLGLVGLGFILAGCVITPQMQYPGTRVVSRRVAVLPSEGMMWIYDFYGDRTLDRAGSLEAKKNIDDSLTYRVRRYGGRSFGAASIEGLDDARAFRSWAVDTLTEVMGERLAVPGQRHESVGDFRFSKGLGSWRAPLDADFVLVTLFIDGHDTAGRSLAVAVGGGYRAARRAIACAVHLQSGRLVWCKLDSSVGGDLLLRRGAQEEVDLLLGEMLNEGQTAPSEPPPAHATSARIVPADDVPPPPPPPPPVPGPDTPAPVHFGAPAKPNNAGPP